MAIQAVDDDMKSHSSVLQQADNSDVEEPLAFVQMQLSPEEKLETEMSLLSFFEPLR